MEDLFLEVENVSSKTPGPIPPAKVSAHPSAPIPLRPLNRAALGRRVFGPSPSAQRDRKILNRIVHPRVRLAMFRLVLYYYILGYWAVVLDIPLLFESGLDIFCSVVIMVAVRDLEVQMRRLLDRDRDKGLGRIEAENRVLSQGKVEEKVGRTRERGGGRGVVVWNDEGLGQLRKEVERAVKEMQGGEVRQENSGDGGEEIDGDDKAVTYPLPLQKWWNWWLWVSPWAAAFVASVEVWRGWRARRRWEAREKAAGHADKRGGKGAGKEGEKEE